MLNRSLMVCLLYFLTAFAIHTENVTVHTQAEYYINNIESQHQTSESLWALSYLYFSAPKEKRQDILQAINDPSIKSALDNTSSTSAFLYDVNKIYRSESILLYQLLTEANQERRKQLYDEFYENHPDTLNSIWNSAALSGEVIEYENIEYDEYLFELYLVTQFSSVSTLYSDELLNDIHNKWLTIIHEESNSLKDDIKTLTVFNSLYLKRDFNALLKLYESLKNLEKFPTSVIKRDIMWDLEFAAYRVGKIDRSLQIQRDYTIPLSKYLEDTNGLNAIYSSHGGYLYILGRYQEAREVFNKSLEYESELSDVNLTRLFNNLSLIYFKTGESNQYVSTQLRALEHAERINNYDHQLSIFRNLHLFYVKNRNWDLAYDYINQAIELALHESKIDDLISLYSFKADFVFEAYRDFERAYSLIEKAESFFSEESEVRIVIRALYEKASLLRVSGQNHKSLQVYRSILDKHSSDLNLPSFLELTLQIANMEFKTGNTSEAKELLAEFRAHDISVIDFPVFVLYQTLRGKILQSENQYTEVRNIYDQTASMIFERTRNSADFESGYWSVEPEYLDFFESYADFLVSRNEYSDALLLLDRVKTINDATLLENPLVRESRMTEEELVEERELTSKMDGIRKKLFNASGSERMELQRELEQLNARRTELTRNLEQVDLYSLPSVWTIQRSLRQNQMILHVTEINDHYYVAEVHRDDVKIRKKYLDETIRNRFEEAVQSTVTGRTNLKALYDSGRFLDIQSIPDRINSIIIMPDGYLHQLPLSIFPVYPVDSEFSYGSATYMIEKASLQTANSLLDLTRRESPNNFTSDFTGFGVSDFQNEKTNRNLVPLPNAPSEVVSISSKLNRFSNNKYFIEENASSENFRAFAGNSRILHLASHSEVSESDPLFSRIHLSASSDSNPDELSAQLFAYELFDLNLQNDLVMLNSCESGAGRYLQGSGIMGISRALRYAGAKSLVLNAWSVNDHFAADFAEEFYRHINNGETKSRALQLTKLHFMSSKNANPHYWGPYILNGSDAPLIDKPNTMAGNVILALTFLAGLVIISFKSHTLNG